MASYTLTPNDKKQMDAIRARYASIERLLNVGRSHMGGGIGSNAGIITTILAIISEQAPLNEGLQWPDLEARRLSEAKQDKTLQKLIKKASRKTPI